MNKRKTNMNKDNFDNIIKRKLENYSLPVEDDCWNEIEERLNPKSKKIILWPWISGAVAASIMLLLWIFPLNQKIDSHETAEQLSGHEPSITKEVLTNESTQLDLPSDAKLELFVGITKQKKPIEENSDKSVFSDDSVAKLEEKEKDTPVAKQTPSPKEKQVAKDYLAFHEEETDSEPFISRRPKRKQSVGISFASGGKLLAMNDKNLNGDIGLRSSNIVPNPPHYLIADILTPQDFSKISHYIPLSFGLSVRKELSSVVAIESGLTYSLLSSKFENENPRRYATMDLHYLGIPLNVVTKIYGNKYSKFNVYFSAGASIEKGLLSHFVQTDFEDNVIDGIITKTDDKIKGFQWSLNAALGLEYKLDRNYSVYFEPEVTYYLENNQPFSIRTQNPLIVGVNLGLRYTW
jgi:hypothetical protein